MVRKLGIEERGQASKDMKMSYSSEAIKDLTRLREFIALKNPLAAQRIANGLLKGIEKLKIFTRMGVSVEKAPDPEVIRDLFVEQYTGRFFLQAKRFFVLRLWHDKESEKDLGLTFDVGQLPRSYHITGSGSLIQIQSDESPESANLTP